MVFCFDCYNQEDWWRLTHSYDLGAKAKQEKSWLLKSKENKSRENHITALLSSVSQLSQSRVLFPLHLSHIQQWNLIVCSLQGSFIAFMSTVHKSSGKSVNVVKCCVMDYLLMLWIFPDSLVTSHLQPRNTWEIGLFLGEETLLNEIPAEGRSPCAFHCSCARAVGNNSLQDQEPAWTQF